MERIKAVFNKPEPVFLILGVLFGLLFMFITPMFQVPDEQAHLHRAVEVANGVFCNKEVPKFSEYDRILHENSMIKLKIKGFTEKFHTVSGYSPVMYLSSALGVKVGALFENPILMFYLARLFNLFVWLALIYFSIKITPVFKWHFALFALLPMSIYVGMSISADSFVNGFLFLFFAYMFKLIFAEKDRLSRKEIFVYFVMSLISGLLKGCLIYPAFLMLFVKDKRKWFVACSVIAVSVLFGGFWAANNYVATGAGAEPTVNKVFILYHPFKYILLFFKTLVISSVYWIKGSIGILGWLNIRFPLWVYHSTMLVYFLSLLTIPSEKYINRRLRLVAFGLMLLYILVVLTALFCVWTPLGASRIAGFQGRYLICIFPLIFLLFGQNRKLINFQRYIKYYLIYVFILLTYTCFILYKVYQFS